MNTIPHDDLKAIYDRRFSGKEIYRRKGWSVLVSSPLKFRRSYLQELRGSAHSPIETHENWTEAMRNLSIDLLKEHRNELLHKTAAA